MNNANFGNKSIVDHAKDGAKQIGNALGDWLDSMIGG